MFSISDFFKYFTAFALTVCVAQSLQFNAETIRNFSFTPQTLQGLHISGTSKGRCDMGKVYGPITDTKDILKFFDELECLYAAGIVPDKIPLGPYYGEVLSFFNNGVFNPIISFLWKGKFATLLRCRENELYMSWNIAGFKSGMPASLTIGSLELNISKSEYDDGRGSLILDYTKDFGELCPNNPSRGEDVDMSLLNNIYPIDQIVDTVRLVGRTPQGGAIYLGKTYLIDFFDASSTATTIAYWTIKNYDKFVNPDFTSGNLLPPLEKSFNYELSGILNYASKLVPIQELFFEPVQTTVKYFEYLNAFINTYKRNGLIGTNRAIRSYRNNIERRILYISSILSSLLSQIPALSKLLPEDVANSIIDLSFNKKENLTNYNELNLNLRSDEEMQSSIVSKNIRFYLPGVIVRGSEKNAEKIPYFSQVNQPLDGLLDKLTLSDFVLEKGTYNNSDSKDIISELSQLLKKELTKITL